jgi:hypothetical protein
MKSIQQNILLELCKIVINMTNGFSNVQLKIKEMNFTVPFNCVSNSARLSKKYFFFLLVRRRERLAGDIIENEFKLFYKSTIEKFPFNV